jgi:hypothetical protein
MPGGKRKSEAPESERKSKKEKIAEIRKRVAEGFGIEDKARVEAARAKYRTIDTTEPPANAKVASATSPLVRKKKEDISSKGVKKTQAQARENTKAYVEKLQSPGEAESKPPTTTVVAAVAAQVATPITQVPQQQTMTGMGKSIGLGMVMANPEHMACMAQLQQHNQQQQMLASMLAAQHPGYNVYPGGTGISINHQQQETMAAVMQERAKAATMQQGSIAAAIQQIDMAAAMQQRATAAAMHERAAAVAMQQRVTAAAMQERAAAVAMEQRSVTAAIGSSAEMKERATAAAMSERSLTTTMQQVDPTVAMQQVDRAAAMQQMVPVNCSAASLSSVSDAARMQNRSRNTWSTPSKAPSQEEESEDLVAPPLDNAQISQVVLENGLSDPSQPPPHASFPQLPLVNPDSDEESATEEDMAEDVTTEYDVVPSRKLHYPFSSVAGARGFIALAAAVGFGLWNSSETLFLRQSTGSKSWSNTAVDVPCFLDNSGDTTHCQEQGVSGNPCPDGAICRFGEISGCFDPFYAKSQLGVACVLNEDNEKKLSTLTSELLNQHKARASCDIGDPPLFLYNEVRSLHPELPMEDDRLTALLEGTGKFELHRVNEHLALSFSPRVSANELTFACKVANAFRLSLNLIGSFINVSGVALLSQGVSVTMAHPLFSILGMLFVLGASKYVGFRKKKAANIRLLETARFMVLERLRSNPSQAHVAVHLRDSILDELYAAHEKEKRAYFAKVMFQKVASAVVKDTRVIKIERRSNNGRMIKFWQWDAMASPKRTAR